MRIPSSNAAPAAASRPAFSLSPASARTPVFRALFPQLRLLGRVLKDLKPQTPRWPMQAGPQRPPRGLDKFSQPVGHGAGIPIRICSADAGLPQRPLRLEPWHGSALKPWCGTRLKPWLSLPHVFRPLGKLLDRVCRAICEEGPRGKGVPIRIN
ncbi:hypothetical protein [Myxococcus sp. RHSTA-1-4]|uniref:hypothetical protein n=1 Tax=Myxococcus sp. RHSTA-1-4 TaxID=2874601 RepID=UPI001CBDEB19|nr:hypothetical protein [Myxococcus sp. RHSTA-1-4]MBZ4421167.1 hypothetical protein [Myxococcus sp. RHSTA-1-4]